VVWICDHRGAYALCYCSKHPKIIEIIRSKFTSKEPDISHVTVKSATKRRGDEGNRAEAKLLCVGFKKFSCWIKINVEAVHSKDRRRRRILFHAHQKFASMKLLRFGEQADKANAVPRRTILCAWHWSARALFRDKMTLYYACRQPPLRVRRRRRTQRRARRVGDPGREPTRAPKLQVS
jgi:hypothetical protein